MSTYMQCPLAIFLNEALLHLHVPDNVEVQLPCIDVYFLVGVTRANRKLLPHMPPHQACICPACGSGRATDCESGNVSVIIIIGGKGEVPLEMVGSHAVASQPSRARVSLPKKGEKSAFSARQGSRCKD